MERIRFVTTDPPSRWWAIPDTSGDLQKAIKRGARFATWLSFSGDPSANDQVTRFGDLVVDFDHVTDPVNALSDVRKLCLELLSELYGVDPRAITYFASGSKGFHAVVPASLFGLESGHRDLHLIYKIIVHDWVANFDLTTVDMSMYCGGRGKMFRLPNLRRPNGRYKVPLKFEEVRDLDIGALLDLTRAPRQIEPVDGPDIEAIPALMRMVQDAIATIEAGARKNGTEAPPPKFSNGEVPPCIAAILANPPARSDRVNFNKLTLILATFVKAVGWTDEEAWQYLQGLIQAYQSQTYNTVRKRRRKWEDTLAFVRNREDYAFECSYVLGLRHRGFSCSTCVYRSTNEPDILEELHQKLTLVTYNGTVVIAFDEPQINEAGFELFSPASLRLLFMNKLITLPDSGGKKEPKKVNPVDLWLRSERRKECRGIIFDPSGNSKGAYNLWRGLAIEPDPTKSCDRILEHIFEVICAGDTALFDYIIAWLANLFREPAAKPGTAIVLRGSQGCGKGTLANIVGPIVGRRHFAHITHQSHLTGRFNSYLADKLLVFVDEALWAGDKQAEGILKGLITEPRLVIEPKGKEAFTVENHVRLLIASNNDWVVPAAFDDRRFFVLSVSGAKRGDHQYFQSLYEEIEGGGRAAFLHYLLTTDLPEVNLREIPQTDGLLDQKIRSLDAVAAFWWDQISEGDLWDTQAENGYLTREEVYGGFVKFCASRRQRAETTHFFWRKTEQLIGQVASKGRRHIGFPPAAVVRRVVALPDKAEAMDRFTRVINGL